MTSLKSSPSSRLKFMVAGTTASIAFHGMVLGLPGWHSPAPSPSLSDPAPSGSGGGAIEVTRLPQLPPKPSAISAPKTSPPPTSETASPLPPANGAQEVPSPPLPDRLTAEETIVPPLEPEAIEPEAVEPEAPAPTAMNPPSPSDLPEEQGVARRQPDAAPLTLEVRLQDPTAYGYDGSKVMKAGEMGLSLQTWTGEDQFFPTKVDPLVVPYSLGDLCLETPPTFGVLAVILAADGTPQRGPTLISSTGYPILDEKAQAMILAGEYPFPDRTQPVGYSLEVQVAYPDACR